MTSKKKILFIINPISGRKSQSGIAQVIDQCLDHKIFESKYYFTKSKNDAYEKTKSAVRSDVCIVCAVGGDGTINEVVRGLVGTDIALAIIPRGSGNGLANHLKIPLTPALAVELVNKNNCIMVDTARLSDHIFVNIAGVGFDAKVAHAFDVYGKRGLLSYAILSLKLFFSYAPKIYQIKSQEHEITEKALFITVANASQFGNRATIAPNASIQDGKLDLIIIKPFHWWNAFYFIWQMFRGELDKSKYYESFSVESAEITSSENLVHIDGEPFEVDSQFMVSVLPKSLKIHCDL